MACALCSVGAGAQSPASPQAMGPGNLLAPASVARQGQPLPHKSASLLRSAANQLLPDSILYPNEAGGYNKDIYTYTDEGLMSSQRSIQWDYSSQAYTENVLEYEYDARGNVIRQYSSYGSGEESTSVYQNTYDEQGRLVSVSGVRENHDGSFVRSSSQYEYDGNNLLFNGRDSLFSTDGTFLSVSYSKDEYHYDDAGNTTKIIWYSLADLDADGVQDTWYPWYVFEYAYDSRGFQVYNLSANNNVNGERTFESVCEIVYSDDSGLNYVSTYSSRYWDSSLNGLGEPILVRYEMKAGNPAIEYLFYSNEDGTWQEPQVRRLIYYPQGGEAANETIGGNAEPAFRAYAADGALVVTTNEATPVRVFAVTGACLYDATVDGMAAIRDLPAGIYIVKVGNEALKISVR